MFNFIADSDAIDSDLNKVFAESKRKAEPVKEVTTLAEGVQESGQDGADIDMELDAKEEDLKDDKKADRTIFIGNLPVSVAEKKTVLKKLKKVLMEFGTLESIRFRSIAFANLMPKRVAFLTKKFHPERDSLNAYAVFADSESVQKSLALNGTVFEGKHIRVDAVAKETTPDLKRCIFIGNLPFSVADEVLWEFFGKVGEIENVRVIRDKKTNVGKGFAYVQFKEKTSVTVALEYHDTEVAGRKIRIQRCAKPKALVKLEGQRSKLGSKAKGKKNKKPTKAGSKAQTAKTKK
ncbi:Nucleolar protein 12 [Dinochytrium kinnereticum]|nr:Nucleolar protein 12 [Dinochytrium kinnereticum]